MWNVKSQTYFDSFIVHLWYTMLAIDHKTKLCLQWHVHALRPRQHGRKFPDDILNFIFLNENVWISLTIYLTCVRKVRNNNIPSLVQRMDWHRTGEKPLSEPMMVSLLTHICVTRSQWVNFRLMRYKWLIAITWHALVVWSNLIISVVLHFLCQIWQ